SHNGEPPRLPMTSAREDASGSRRGIRLATFLAHKTAHSEVRVMAAAPHRPTDDDRREAILIALTGLAYGRDPGGIAARLEPLHPRNNTFPGGLLLDLAADALEVAAASRGVATRVRGHPGAVLARVLRPYEGSAPQQQVRSARGGDDPRRRRPRVA